MIPPNVPDQYQPCFEIKGFAGWDAVAALLLPRRVFARRVARKLVAHLGGCRGFVLPEGSVWGIEADGRVTRLV